MNRRLATLIVLIALFSTPLLADGPLNTGINTFYPYSYAGGMYTIDQSWTVTAAPAGESQPIPSQAFVVTPVIGYYMPNSSTSSWIGLAENAKELYGDGLVSNPDGNYSYSQLFTLNQNTPIYFRYTQDNSMVSITNELVSTMTMSSASVTGQSSSQYRDWSALTSIQGFAGVNKITFTVYNEVQQLGNPTALRVEFLPLALPEIKTWLILGSFLALVGMFRAARVHS